MGMPGCNHRVSGTVHRVRDNASPMAGLVSGDEAGRRRGKGTNGQGPRLHRLDLAWTNFAQTPQGSAGEVPANGGQNA